jgi:glycerol uptake facilitator-like aquaporin
MQQYLIEFLGTLFLVTVIFVTGNYLAIGAALAIAVLLGGAVSGGAFNPAVAVSLYTAGKISLNDAVMYSLVEILGAIAGFTLYNNFLR